MSSRLSDAAARMPASPDDIDIAAIGAAIKRHALKLVLASAVAGGAAYALTKVMVPKYMSQAQIEIISKGVGNPFEQRRESGSAPDNVTVRMDKEAIGTHVRGLMSTDLALKVARDLELAKLPEFNSALREPGFLKRYLGFLASVNPRETDEDRVLKAYNEAMRAYQVKRRAASSSNSRPSTRNSPRAPRTALWNSIAMRCRSVPCPRPTTRAPSSGRRS